MATHYDILEVSPAASDPVIRAAYRSLAQRYHPDRCKEPGAAERMKAINEAYGVLSDPARRRRYDDQLARERAQGNASAAEAAARQAAAREREAREREARERAAREREAEARRRRAEEEAEAAQTARTPPRPEPQPSPPPADEGFNHAPLALAGIVAFVAIVGAFAARPTKPDAPPVVASAPPAAPVSPAVAPAAAQPKYPAGNGGRFESEPPRPSKFEGVPIPPPPVITPQPASPLERAQSAVKTEPPPVQQQASSQPPGALSREEWVEQMLRGQKPQEAKRPTSPPAMPVVSAEAPVAERGGALAAAAPAATEVKRAVAAIAPGKQRSLSAGEELTIMNACSRLQRKGDVAGYQDCRETNVALAMNAGPLPDTTGLSAGTSLTLMNAQRNGDIVAYHECMTRNIAIATSNGPPPSTYGLPAGLSIAIMNACDKDQRRGDVAAYHECVSRQLALLPSR